MLHSINTLPTHLVVGVRKSATSWLWKQIEKRNDVSVSATKEIYFFDDNYDKGISWYKKHFAPNKTIVDNTPDYFVPKVAKKIKDTLPHANIMVVLRNPIQRSFSHFKFSRYIQRLDLNVSFYEAWNQDKNFIRTKSLYDEALLEFKYYFGEKFKIFLFDDLENKPHKFLNNYFNFLNIEPNSDKNLLEKWMPRADRNLKDYYVINADLKLNSIDKKMLIDYYKESVNKTANIIGRDLSSWLK